MQNESLNYKTYDDIIYKPKDYIEVQHQITLIKEIFDLINDWQISTIKNENSIKKQAEIGKKLSQIHFKHLSSIKNITEFNSQLNSEQKAYINLIEKNNEIIFENFQSSNSALQKLITYTIIEDEYMKKTYNEKEQIENLIITIKDKCKEVLKNSNNIINKYNDKLKNNEISNHVNSQKENKNKKQTQIYEFIDKSKIIYKRIEEYQKEISTNSNRAYDYQEQLTKCIKKYNLLETEDEKNTYLAENNSQSLKYNLCAYLNQIKKINSDIKSFNNYINKLCIFQTNQTNINQDLEDLMNKSKSFCIQNNEIYEKILSETSLLLNNPSNEIVERIYKLINSSIDIENFSKQSNNLLDDALYNIKNLEKAANDCLDNQEINVEINENNYDYKSVFNQTSLSPSIITPKSLQKSSDFEIISGLNIPNITLEDVMKHSYRAHNLYDAKTYSLKGNDKFNDDEYVYQEFLSYVTYKMRENEQYLSEKLEGLHPSKKRELLENYLTKTLVEITNEIKVNKNEVKLTGYTFQDCATQFILRVNGYDIKRDTNIKDFLSGASRCEIIKSNPIDQTTFFKEFSENFKPTNYDDANIKRILNEGRGITNDDYKHAKIVKDKVEEFKNLIMELQKENNYENYQTIIDKISNHQILKGLTKSEYNTDNIYKRNVQFSDQMENFSMLISNNEKINFLDYEIAKEIYQKLSIDYKKTNKNASTDEKNELCNKALEQCDEILKNTKQIISTYASENTRSITAKPIIKQKITIEPVVQAKKETTNQTHEINESIKPTISNANNLETKENIKNPINESLEKEKKELKEMIKKVLQNATKQQVEEFKKSYKKNYTALASKCSEDDYQKIYGKFFFKAEDIVTKPEKITIEDIKTLGIYLGLENIDKTKIGQNTIKNNDTQKIIDMLESTTKQTTTIKK